MSKYLTLESASQGLYKEKGSKFFAYAYPVNSEEGFRDLLKKHRKEQYDARHHCTALVVGDLAKASDDGEPSNSAGQPILGQIKSMGLNHVGIVVVRYFGGNKLGVPGLINAYRESAKMALESATIKEVLLRDQYTVKCEYAHLDELMRQIGRHEIKVDQQEFDVACQLTISIWIDHSDAFFKSLELRFYDFKQLND